MMIDAKDTQKAFVLSCRFLADAIGCPKIHTEDAEISNCAVEGENVEKCEKEDQWECWQRYFLERIFNEQVCRVCGCTQENACPGGCWWVEDDLCSSCCEKLKSLSAP